MEEVLQLLADDARLTAAQIAERTGRTEDEVASAIEKLEKAGVIRRYKTVVDWDKVGVEHVYGFIEVRVSPERGVGFDAVAERIMRFPEVRSLYLLSGGYDLHVVVEGKDLREIAHFVTGKLATLDTVMSTTTHFVLKGYKVDGDIMEDVESPSRLPVSM